MKDYNEMADAVFRRRDEYLVARKKKTGVFIKIGTPLCALLLVVVAGVGIWRAGLPEIPAVKPTEPTTQVQTDENTANSTEESFTSVVNSSVVDVPVADPTEVADVNSDNTQDNIDPTEVKPTQSGDTLQSATSATDSKNPGADSATDPIEPKPDWDNAGSDQPLTDPFKPVVPSKPGNEEPPTEDNTVPTDAPTDEAPPPWSGDTAIPDDPTVSPTEGSTSSPWGPDVPVTEPPQPTEPPTGPLTITVGDETYVAQTGDVVTYTVELYMAELFESIQCVVVHSKDELQAVEWVDLQEEDPVPVHFPNLTGGSVYMNYHYGRYTTSGVSMNGVKLRGFDFREQKVLLTYDFLVTAPGEAEIYLNMQELCRKGDGDEYFTGSEQVIFEGIEIYEYLTVTPASEAVLPTIPDESKPTTPTAPVFEYPEESADGDMIINCDDRTYSANVGDTVTYVMEVWASELFENFQGYMTYGEGGLEIIDRTEGRDAADAGAISAPNLPNSLVNYYTGSHPVTNEGNKSVPYSANVAASNISPGFDFRDRKVLVQLEFLVTEPGEKKLDMYIVSMSRRKDSAEYFAYNEQFILEGVQVYEYVLVTPAED